MKNTTLFFLSFLFSSFLFAQDKDSKQYTARQVAKVAVYPGCESINQSDNLGLQKCLQQGLSELLSQHLIGFSDKMVELEITQAIAKVQFVISKEGKITEIEALKGGTAELGIAAVNALKRIASTLPNFQPAELEGGDKAKMVFQLPIRYSVIPDTPESPENPDTAHSSKAEKMPDFDFNELIISTLIGEKEVYEVRINKDEDRLKVYETSTGQDIFLGNFISASELLEIEPYKSLILAQGDFNLLTESKIEGEMYRFYINKNPDGLVYIYKLNKGVEKLEKTLSEMEFMNDKSYLNLLIKN